MQQTFKAVKISDHGYWVGAVDWLVRDFHGYATNDLKLCYDLGLQIGDKLKTNCESE